MLKVLMWRLKWLQVLRKEKPVLTVLQAKARTDAKASKRELRLTVILIRSCLDLKVKPESNGD
jgi:hypothetical protein